MRRNYLYMYLVTAMIVMFVGCSTASSKEKIPSEFESSVYSEEGQTPPESFIENTERELIRGTAIRIDRIHEEYDYSEWNETIGWFPGVISLIPDGLEAVDWDSFLELDLDGNSSSTMKDAVGSAIVFTNIYSTMPIPADAVISIVEEIQDEGVDVEYGEFRIRPLENIRNWINPDGYYYKRINDKPSGCIESEDWDAQVFFTTGSEGEKVLLSFSLKLNDAGYINDNLITYETFFKIANSFYVYGTDPKEYYAEFTGKVQ